MAVTAAAVLGACAAVPALPTSTAAALSHGPARLGAPASVVDCRITKCVALTFDDGPTQYTAAVLDALERQRGVATFFLIGPHALQYRKDVVRQQRDGDAIGDHTVTHPHLTRLTPARIDYELEIAAGQIASVTGHRPTLFRPPFGAWNAKVRAAAGAEGLSVVMWSVSSKDWKYHNAHLVEQRVLARVRPGAIIVLHDRYATTPPAVPHIIHALKARGYVLVTVPQMSATTGGLQPGVVYHHGP
ncbi:polysaccharide deacetylase family protein [Streptomyces sp. Ag109_G2-15]|uniref:polysaccharide deacetylase family protein n=1 Tax=Streptomyces sp. Ag109_G2-15 TaxID=1938850 RepID=UPI000BC8DE82|nr:polysaccharide deacetylase family protein [Streptomyces sp. Ag109_G2-15]SOE08161.1 Peptidoglycan/xylan/chitin deacetylase, PgdA/CDA1 family [Streptomyces sp. Ag109_G2-15]